MPSLAKSSSPDRQKYQESTCHRETLKWTPKHELNEQQLKQYLVLARAVSMFAKVVRNDDPQNDETGNNPEQNEPVAENSKEIADNLKDEDPDVLNKFKLIFRGLSQFVNAHHPSQPGDSNCRLLRRSRNEFKDAAVAGDESPANSRPETDKSSDALSILPASEWTETECILFAAALQACGNSDSHSVDHSMQSCADSLSSSIGQNFSIIKREFLPWKNCKNIIDYYQLCLNQQSDQTGRPGVHQPNSIEDERKKCTELRNKLDARSADGKDAKLRQCSIDINNIILDLIRANSGHNQALRESNRKGQQTVSQKDNDSNDGSPNGSSLSGSLPSSVTKSLRTSRSGAKTNSSNEDKTGGSAKEQTTTEKRTSKSLKLNLDKKMSPRTANKVNQSHPANRPNEEAGKAEPKDQYEFDDQLETECLGSLKFYKDGQLVLKLKAKQPANDNKCQWEESADSAELSKQRACKKKRVESNRTREPLEKNNKQTKNADENQGDDSPFESDDSRGSSEFSLQRPLTMSGLFKKAKVKVENNYVPLPSLNSASKDDESDLESGNRKSISPNGKLNSDDLKRKLRTPKSSATKKSKVLKLNECTNKLNISPDLIQQQLDSFNTTTSANPLVDQLTFLTSLPLDVRQKLISDSLLKNSRLNELNGLNNLINSSVPINADNAFLENIDKIKMRNQIECLMSNLNALIEADQLK